MCCSWFIYLIGSLLAGLFGWLLRGYFTKRKFDKMRSDQESANASINRLAAYNDKAKHEHDAKIKNFQHEIKNLEETMRVEKEAIHKKWILKANNLNTELTMLQEENTALQQSIDDLNKKCDDESSSQSDIVRLKEELAYYKEKSLKHKNKYKKLEKKHLKSQKSSNKQTSRSKAQSIADEVPVEITKRVEVQETVDFKKLKKLLTNKLPTVTKTRVIDIVKKKNRKSKNTRQKAE